MTAGKLAAAKPAATTNTTLYQCPITQSASTVLEVCNQSGSSATYRAALRDYNQILTLDSSSYTFRKGNVISDYKLTISPGIATADFDPGDTILLDNNQGSFKIQDVYQETDTIVYNVKVEPIGQINIDSTSQVGTFSVGNTVTGATTGLTATIYRVGISNLYIKIPQVTSSSTSIYLNNVTGVLANDYISTGSEIMQISSLTGYNATVTRGQFATTAASQTPGTQVIIFRSTATTTTLNGAIDNITLSVTLTSATGIIVGDYIKIDDELMQVQSISGNVLQVTRGTLSTTPASHTDTSTVTVYQSVQVCNLQFFVLTEEIGNGSGATVDLNVTSGSGSTFSQGNRYVYDLDGVNYQFPPNIPVDGDRIVRFDQSDSSNTGHPLRLSLTQDGTWQGGVALTTGVTIAGTPGSSGAYTEVNLSLDLVGTNTSYYIYCANHALMSENGFLSIDITPNYPDIYIFDTTKATLTASDTFSIGNVNYTITSVQIGPYGYVTNVNGSNLSVSLGLNSTSFASTDVFYDSPLTPASERTQATVSSVSVINDTDYIYYGKTINANSTDTKTGLVVGPGQSIMVYSSAADLNYVVHGFVDNTSDFVVDYYIRQRPASN
jgi:hypothetical protein